MDEKSSTLRPPVKWHGGKHYLCHRIIEQFPLHHTYVEPFGGAASVLLNKPPSPVEVYNDLDQRITRLLRVLRDDGAELRRRLSLTPYSECEFEDAKTETTDEIEHARRDFVRWRLSLGGRGDSFSFTLHRVRRGMADVVSGYLSMIDAQLPLIVARLRTVEILCRPAIRRDPHLGQPGYVDLLRSSLPSNDPARIQPRHLWLRNDGRRSPGIGRGVASLQREDRPERLSVCSLRRVVRRLADNRI